MQETKKMRSAHEKKGTLSNQMLKDSRNVVIRGRAHDHFKKLFLIPILVVLLQIVIDYLLLLK